MAVIMGLGLLFHILLGFRYSRFGHLSASRKPGDRNSIVVMVMCFQHAINRGTRNLALVGTMSSRSTDILCIPVRDWSHNLGSLGLGLGLRV